jgi:hypothetical protein
MKSVKGQVFFNEFTQLGATLEKESSVPKLLNMQPILEMLLRQAVDSCDHYASDILIFLENTYQSMCKDEVSEVDMYFYNSGITWEDNTGHSCGSVPVHYRSFAKLVRNASENTVTIYQAYGNV